MKYFAEFHDSSVAQIETSASTVDLKIDHIPVFRQVKADRFEVFSSSGRMRVIGAPDSNLAPGAGEILDVEGVSNLVELSIQGGVLRRQFPITFVAFHLADGSTWSIRGTEAILELSSEGRTLTPWEGPLWDKESEQQVLWLR